MHKRIGQFLYAIVEGYRQLESAHPLLVSNSRTSFPIEVYWQLSEEWRNSIYKFIFANTWGEPKDGLVIGAISNDLQ